MSVSIANLRNEIPLFPAVRSGEITLVALLVQAWPAGCCCILQNLTEDLDNLYSDWMSWDILELLLRGAVSKLTGCTLLEGQRPPSVRLVTNEDWRSFVQPSTPPSWEKQEDKKQKKQKKDNQQQQPQVHDTTQIESDIRYITRLVPPSTTPTTMYAGVNGATSSSVPPTEREDISNIDDNASIGITIIRSKSPILQDDNNATSFPAPNRDNENTDRKRAYNDETDREDTDLYPCHYPQFFPSRKIKGYLFHFMLHSKVHRRVMLYSMC